MRRTARENAFKLIFETLVSGGDAKISHDAFVADMAEDGVMLMDRLYNGADGEREFLSNTISRYARGFKLDRIYKIDLAILMVASYEILFCEDIPDKVSANEAVEIAKIYSTDNSPSFINGILAGIIRDKEDIINERNAD